MIRAIIIKNEILLLKELKGVKVIMDFCKPISICVEFKNGSTKIFKYGDEQELYTDFYRIAAALNGVYWEVH